MSMVKGLLLIVVAVGIVVGLVTHASSGGDSSASSSTPRQQHFTFSGETTTCRQWISRMSDDARDSAAVDLMDAMTNADGKGSASGKDILALEDGITTACKSYPGDKVSDIASTLYVMANPN